MQNVGSIYELYSAHHRMNPFSSPFAISAYVTSTTFQQVSPFEEWHPKLGHKINWHEPIVAAFVLNMTWNERANGVCDCDAPLLQFLSCRICFSSRKWFITVLCCGTKRKLALRELNLVTLDGNQVCLRLNCEHLTFFCTVLETWEWRLQINKFTTVCVDTRLRKTKHLRFPSV